MWQILSNKWLYFQFCCIFYHIRDWRHDGASSRNGPLVRNDSSKVCIGIRSDHKCCPLDYREVNALSGISISYLHCLLFCILAKECSQL